MQILDGKTLAEKIKTQLKQKVSTWAKQQSLPPCLTMILVGKDPASQVYIGQKIKAGKQVGIKSQLLVLPEDISIKDLKHKIKSLNQDPKVHGVLVQLPLPLRFDWREVTSWIDPKKDPDSLTLENQGLLWLGKARVLPCTPYGIIRLLEHYSIPIKSKHAVIVGRSHIVGLPMAQMLLKANATVTVCHSYTKKLSNITRQGDIVVVSAGAPGLLGKKDFKKGAVVVDVGIHRTIKDEKKILIGDTRFEELKDWASFATPVPGGVGPMTVAQLLENTFQLASCSSQV